MKSIKPQKLPINEIDWEGLIPLIGEANRSLAYFDGVLQGITNPDLLLSPLTTREAVLSSRIEGTQATLGDVLRFEAGETPKEEQTQQDIYEIINYRNALLAGELALKKRPFNLNLLKKIHAVLLHSVRGRSKDPGQFRKVQNWIGAPGSPIEKAQFIPPSPELIADYLDNWEKYYHLVRPDPIVQLGIIHAQFEIIHPFLDGNGRLGRMIIPLFLYERKILSRPMFYLSEYFESHRDEYIERLRMLGRNENAWNEWILFFLRAVNKQAQTNARKARSIIDLYRRLKKVIIDETHSQYAVPLLDRLFLKPIFQVSQLQGITGMPSRPMINTLITKLKRLDILKVIRESRGRRGQVLVLSELINICEGREVM